MDILSQWVIAILGPIAVFLVSLKTERVRRWGYIAGALSQPFWFVTLWQNHQWPVFVAAAVYTYSWCQGVYNFWWRGDK